MDGVGILDPDGKNNNPLTGNVYSEGYKELAKIWSSFPIYNRIKDIIDNVNKHQVLLVVAETGSGKTVIMPKIVLHSLNYKGRVAVTLPKQIIAKSASEFSAKTLDVKLGEEVGYQYRGASVKSKNTKLLYATDGTIVARLLKDPKLIDFDAVVIDEAHERKIQIDLLLYLLRETLKMRPEFKLVIMSATVNVDIFTKYFNEFSFKTLNISGERRFPIESIFLKEPFTYQDILNKGFDIMMNIIKEDDITKGDAHDILFFVTSANEAYDMCKRIRNACKGTKTICKNGIFCVEVFANVNETQQKLAQDKTLYKTIGDYSRKIVVSTNVAESSLTVDGIKYVIDTGYELKSSYDPDYRATRLDRQLISQAQARQRMGRAGRTESGVCYHLYTKNDFENLMEKFPEPDIRTTDITEECLRLLTFDTIKTVPKLVDVLNNFIEPPKNSYIETAINILTQLGCVSNNNLTELGKIIVEIGTSILNALAIIIGVIYGRERSVMKIVSVMDICKNNLSDLFIIPKLVSNTELSEKEKQQFIKLNDEFKNTQKKFRHKYGDHLSILKIYEKYESKAKNNNEDKLKEWCQANFLKLDILKKSKKNYRKLTDQINIIRDKINNLNFNKCQDVIELDDDKKILYCLYYSHILQTANKIDNKNNYRTLYSGDLKIKINQQSFINFSEKSPSSVFYNELFILLGKADLNIVSKKLKSITKKTD